MQSTEQDQAFALDSMRKYVERKQELDKLLESVARPLFEAGELSVIDVGCGIGHLAPHFNELSPGSGFHGVEQYEYMTEEARRANAGLPQATFEHADAYELPTRYPKGFDVAVAWKVLSAIPAFEPMLDVLLGLARRHVLIGSIFYDGDIDFEITVREHAKDREGMSEVASLTNYNVYSLPRFERYVRERGAADVQVHDFEIPIDLPRGDTDRMGTYTERLADGRRLQLSGAVVMNWKVIRIDLPRDGA
jgi:trans-aconitate methyltransferase